MKKTITLALIIALATATFAATNRTYYARHLGGGRFSSALYDTRATADHYPYISTAPAVTNASVYCRSFRWLVEGESATGVYEVTPVPPSPAEVTRYSVRSIIRELKACDRYDAVRALLTAANYDWEFVGSNYLASDDPDFVRMVAAIVAQGIMSQAEIDAMLPRCVWEETPLAE